MEVVLLTIIALTGADVEELTSVAVPDTCHHCQAADHGGKVAAWEAKRAAKAAEHHRRHMMPQTCYAPRYGCYYSGDRHMHRYPAFHGTFYRRPYNYRNLFDYPWHARLHEPTSLFSYNVDSEPGVVGTVIERSPSDVLDLPPAPPEATEASSPRTLRRDATGEINPPLPPVAEPQVRNGRAYIGDQPR